MATDATAKARPARPGSPSPHATGEMSDVQLLRRFTDWRDGAAFAALVERHEPMVLRVCRCRLGDAHGAEDACQAAFVVLARRAHSLARPERLAGWLYGVAARIAAKAKARAARRAACERRAAAATAPGPLPEVLRRELRCFLDAELGRLPEKYRAPLVLCYWEGLTNTEAARRLGCPPGSMSWRLARGREMLRDRLIRRGAEAVL